MAENNINKENGMNEINDGSNIPTNESTSLHDNPMLASNSIDNSSDYDIDGDLDDLNQQSDHSDINEIKSDSTPDEVFVNVREDALFENYDIMLDDAVRTVSPTEVEHIEKGLFRSVNIKTVIQSRNVLRHGAASVSYYQFFDRILSGSIYADAYRIGSLLKNRSFVRAILFNVLNTLPNRVNRNSNGFLRSNMMLSREDIHNALFNSLSKMISKSREPYRRRFIRGFSSILEVVLISKLVSNKLLDITEMDQKTVTEIRDDIINDMSYEDVKTVIASSQIHDVILKIINATDNIISIDDMASNNNGNNYNVDIDDIIHKVLSSIDEISDYLIMHEIRKSDIDLVLTIASIYRDKIVYAASDEFKELLDEVSEIVSRYSDSFDFLLCNFNFSYFMSQFRTEAARDLIKEGRGYLTIHAERISRTLMEIRRSFDNPVSLLQIVDKDEFLANFTIVNRTNEHGSVYHSFLRRNLSSLKGSKSYETISQFLEPNRDIVFPDLGRDKDLFMLVSNSHYNQNDLDNIVNTIPFMSVLAQERSYSSYLDNLMFRYFDGILVQGCMLFRYDVVKIAYLLSDEVIELYDDFACDLVELAKDNMLDDLTVDTDRGVFGLPIFVKRNLPQYSHHREYYTLTAGNNAILTKIPEKVVALSANLTGSRSLALNSTMLKEGRFVLSEEYVNSSLNKDVIVWPSRSKIQIEIEHGMLEGGIPNFTVCYDFRDICRTTNSLSRIISTRDHYILFMEEYCKALRLFQHTIANLTLTAMELTSVEDLDQVTIKYRDLTKFVSEKSDSDYASVDVLSTINTTSHLFDDNIILSRQIEQGFLAKQSTIDNCPVVSHDIGLISAYDRVKVIDNLKNIVKYRNVTLKSMSYQSFFVNIVNRFYSNNNTFKNFVDKAMNGVKGKNADSYINAINIIRMFSEGTETYISKYITSKTIVVTINMIYSFLTNNINIDQMLRSVKNQNLEPVNMLLNNADNFMNTMLTMYDIINLRDVAALETLVSRELHNDGLSSIGSAYRIEGDDKTGYDGELYTYSSVSHSNSEQPNYRTQLVNIENKYRNTMYGDTIDENNRSNEGRRGGRR